MSQSGWNNVPDCSSTLNITSDITPNDPRFIAPRPLVPSNSDLVREPRPVLQQQPSGQCDSAQADADDDDIGVIHEGRRRESAVSGLQPAYKLEAPTINRNPVMPDIQRADNITPPTLEDLVRRMTGDTSSTRKSSLAQNDAVVSRSSTARSSVVDTDAISLQRTDTGLSISSIARSMTMRVSTVRKEDLSAERASQRISRPDTDGPEGTSLSLNGKKSRKLSFQLPWSLKTKPSSEAQCRPSPVVEECSACPSPNQTSPASSNQCGGLAARRRVKMDITLPTGLPDLSRANDRDAVHPAMLSSIIPSRRRSPKTPWIREKEVTWNQDAQVIPAEYRRKTNDGPTSTQEMKFTALKEVGVQPITEAVQIPAILKVTEIKLDDSPAFPTVQTPLTTPPFERPPLRVRDRCYISRPPTKSNRKWWLSSDSDLGTTPEAHFTPDGEQSSTVQDAYTQKVLFQLAKASKASRARRWPWNRSKTSGSEEQIRVKAEPNEEHQGMSGNIFRRSHRFPEMKDNESKEKRSSEYMRPPWRREKSADKPPLASASLAKMPMPPTFVPPGCEKVDTPPTFDAAREVRGKLADFFFDMNGLSSARQKPKPSPGGYWDSNAVLMSMRTDHALTDDKDEEGPEGRSPPAAFHFGSVNDTPGLDAMPGLYTAPDGYLKVKGTATTPPDHSPITPLQSTEDTWFRMHYGDHSVDEQFLTVTALKEADERRKFEWLVPEHLPNSPLCPLHPKYVGPSKGLCYWHGKKSNGWGVEPRRDYINNPMKIGQGKTRGWDVGKVEAPKVKKKKRRLQSFSGSA